MRVAEFARQLGIGTCLEFDAELLVPEERIRAFCLENKCGNYGKSYMCPPYIGSVEEIRLKLGKFQRGVLLQYASPLKVKGDREGVRQTKVDFHQKVLQLEDFLRESGISEVWGMIGSSCGLCDTCQSRVDKPCQHPDQARTSLEAIAIDVLGLLDKFGLDSEFDDHKITWTGCILFPGTISLG